MQYYRPLDCSQFEVGKCQQRSVGYRRPRRTAILLLLKCLMPPPTLAVINPILPPLLIAARGGPPFHPSLRHWKIPSEKEL